MADWTPPVPPPDEVHNITVALKGAFTAAGEAAASEAGIDFDLVLPEAADYAAARGAELIGMKIVDGQLVPNPSAEWAISDYTRERANELVREAISEGWSIEDFASRLEDTGLFSGDRAELIARNEIALAQVGGKMAAYREADVEYVVVYDGDYDDECAARDGELMDIDEYFSEPFLHPNCTATARPATQSELADAGLLEVDDEAEEAA
jgi:hypothetical protein